MSPIIAAARVEAAAQWVSDGGVIAYPTEGVFGFGCSPFDAAALHRVIGIKRRRADKGMIVVGAEPRHLEPVAGNLAHSLPVSTGRATTWIVPALPGTSPALTGGGATVAVRLTQHPLARALCVAIAGPLVSTSANRAGGPPLRDARAVRLRFGREVDDVLWGACGGDPRPSRIVDWETGHVIRD